MSTRNLHPEEEPLHNYAKAKAKALEQQAMAEKEAQEEAARQVVVTRHTTCQQCGTSFEFQTRPALLESLGIASFTPNICDQCSQVMEEADNASSLAGGLAALVPYRHWDDAKGNAMTLHAVRQAIAAHGSVYVQGDTGQCKTRTLCHLAMGRLLDGRPIRWVDAARLSEQWSMCIERGPTDVEALKVKLLHYPCLVLDDLGKGKMTDHRANCWFDLFDRIAKTEGRVKLWVSTNKTPDNLATCFGDMGRPIIQRIADLCHLVQV